MSYYSFSRWYLGEDHDPMWRRSRKFDLVKLKSSVTPSKSFVVQANQFWSPSEILVGELGEYKVEVIGDQTWKDWTITTDAGMTDIICVVAAALIFASFHMPF
jgi:hypothetical protein